jgi:hypothetical protein
MNLYTRDLFERVAMTFAEGFLGGVVVTQLTDQKMWLAAAAGGVSAALALVKGLAAKRVGNSDSASLDGGV